MLELSEEWSLTRSLDSELDAGYTSTKAVVFDMKMLGSILVAKPSSELGTAEAVKTIVTMVHNKVEVITIYIQFYRAMNIYFST